MTDSIDSSLAHPLETEWAKSKYWRNRAAIAGHFYLRHEWLKVLAHDPDYRVREVIARRPDLGYSLTRDLAMDKNFNVRMVIAQTINLREALVEILAADEHPLIRETIAKYQQDIPNNILKKLAEDIVPEVRMAIAHRTDLYPALMNKLSEDSDNRVRQIIARRPDNPELTEKPFYPNIMYHTTPCCGLCYRAAFAQEDDNYWYCGRCHRPFDEAEILESDDKKICAHKKLRKRNGHLTDYECTKCGKIWSFNWNDIIIRQ